VFFKTCDAQKERKEAVKMKAGYVANRTSKSLQQNIYNTKL